MATTAALPSTGEKSNDDHKKKKLTKVVSTKLSIEDDKALQQVSTTAFQYGSIKKATKSELVRFLITLLLREELHYTLYLNTDETKCIVNEIYANSEATLAHINGVASQTILPKIQKVSRISRLDVYGNPSKELQKVLADIVSQTYIPFVGFSR